MKSIRDAFGHMHFALVVADSDGDLWCFDFSYLNYAEPSADMFVKMTHMCFENHRTLLCSNARQAAKMLAKFNAVDPKFWNAALEDYEFDHQKLTLRKHTMRLYKVYAPRVLCIANLRR